MVCKVVALLAGALLAAGLVVAGLTAYKVIDPLAPARERALQQQLQTQWTTTPAAAAETASVPVVGEKVVRYTDVAVLAPVPGSPGATATSAHITLITCTPVTLLFTPWRVIVTGALVGTQLR